MKHGYTNQTVRAGATVRKVYEGPDADLRQSSELRALTALQGIFPVPTIVASGPGWVSTSFVDGIHGQDLMAAGDAPAVLAECGHLLRRLHDLDPRIVDPSAAADAVICHGDFGPNNMLFAGGGRAIAVIDWEFGGVGSAITDLAWCEWIVRMHHPEEAADLSAFFDAYGSTPPWSARREEMVRRCRWLTDFTGRWDPTGPGIGRWQERTHTTEGWSE